MAVSSGKFALHNFRLKDYNKLRITQGISELSWNQIVINKTPELLYRV